MAGLSFWDKLQATEGKIVARVRAGIAALALIGTAEAHTFAEMISLPAAEAWIKRAMGASVVLAFLLRAGEKNDKPDAKPPAQP